MTDLAKDLAAHASDARRMLAQDRDPSRVTVAALAQGVPALLAEVDEVQAESLDEVQAELLDEAEDMENRGAHTPSFTQGIRYAAAYVATLTPSPARPAPTLDAEVPGWVGEVLAARAAAHAKHGLNSIEALDYTDPRWLAVLVEEVGEVAHELTYDAEPTADQALDVDERARAEARRVRAELLDVLAVASAWLDAADRAIDGAS